MDVAFIKSILLFEYLKKHGHISSLAEAQVSRKRYIVHMEAYVIAIDRIMHETSTLLINNRHIFIHKSHLTLYPQVL